tara:strand:- start:255 stop:572 length:318 start_codon:yes stop_codon:yes gene_type:complete
MRLFFTIADIIVSNVKKVQLVEPGCNSWQYIVDFPGLVRGLRKAFLRHSIESGKDNFDPNLWENYLRELAHNRHECSADCFKSHHPDSNGSILKVWEEHLDPAVK